MSVEAMAVVLHHSRAKGTAKIVLLGIANHSGDGGAWPSVETLARYANVTERAVQRALNDLASMGELAIDVQRGGLAHLKDWRRPNLYHVLLSCPATCDRSMQHRTRSYPQAPLWGDAGVTPTGDARDTPGGDAGVTRTTHLTTPLTSVEKVTLPREAHCRTCGKPESVCRRIFADDHDFEQPAAS